MSLLEYAHILQDLLAFRKIISLDLLDVLQGTRLVTLEIVEKTPSPFPELQAFIVRQADLLPLEVPQEADVLEDGPVDAITLVGVPRYLRLILNLVVYYWVNCNNSN